MLTGITSWTIGSTSAPPFITTFWPPRPVRTNARSFDERRYSQCSSQITIATTIATTMRPRMKVPNWAPVMVFSSVLWCCRLGWRYRLMALNLRVVSVSAASVGSRSMLEAP